MTIGLVLGATMLQDQMLAQVVHSVQIKPSGIPAVADWADDFHASGGVTDIVMHTAHVTLYRRNFTPTDSTRLLRVFSKLSADQRLVRLHLLMANHLAAVLVGIHILETVLRSLPVWRNQFRDRLPRRGRKSHLNSRVDWGSVSVVAVLRGLVSVVRRHGREFSQPVGG